MLRRQLLPLLSVALALVACSPSEATDSTRPVAAVAGVHTPPGYDSARQYPLIVLLHGFGSNAATVESYFGIEPLSAQYGFLYVVPSGTPDIDGHQFWNATDACCDMFGAETDHSAALLELVHQVQAEYSVDPKRIYFVGHSNGGFMSYRMACDHADTVAAIVSLAGASWGDPAKCTPSQPVSVLQIHGTADNTIFYDGGEFSGRQHPAVHTTMELWARYNGCADTATVTASALDLDSGLPDAETSITQYSGCPADGAVELWSIEGGGHGPTLSASFTPSLIEFLLAHARP